MVAAAIADFSPGGMSRRSMLLVPRQGSSPADEHPPHPALAERLSVGPDLRSAGRAARMTRCARQVAAVVDGATLAAQGIDKARLSAAVIPRRGHRRAWRLDSSCQEIVACWRRLLGSGTELLAAHRTPADC